MFYNSLSPEHRSTAISAPFVVGGNYTVQEDVLMPSGGEPWFTGQTQELRWTSYFNRQENLTAEVAVDVDYGWSSTGPWTVLVPDLDYVLITPEVGDPYNSANINVPYAMNGAAVWLRLRFKYQNPDGGPLTEGLEVTDSPIVVYPVDRVFSDATTGSQLAYQGRPYSAITLEASNPPDQRPDLFVTIAEAVDPTENSVLYLNTTFPGQSLSFQATPVVFAPGDLPQLGSLGACAAPLVAGQSDALFVTHQDPGKPRLYIFGHDLGEPKSTPTSRT